MRFFKRANDEPVEVPCPSCQVLVPVGASRCDVCGAYLRDSASDQPYTSDSSANAR